MSMQSQQFAVILSGAVFFIVAGAFVLPAFRGKMDSITLIGSQISVLPI